MPSSSPDLPLAVDPAVAGVWPARRRRRGPRMGLDGGPRPAHRPQRTQRGRLDAPGGPARIDSYAASSNSRWRWWAGEMGGARDGRPTWSRYLRMALGSVSAAPGRCPELSGGLSSWRHLQLHAVGPESNSAVKLPSDSVADQDLDGDTLVRWPDLLPETRSGARGDRRGGHGVLAQVCVPCWIWGYFGNFKDLMAKVRRPRLVTLRAWTPPPSNKSRGLGPKAPERVSPAKRSGASLRA